MKSRTSSIQTFELSLHSSILNPMGETPYSNLGLECVYSKPQLERDRVEVILKRALSALRECHNIPQTVQNAAKQGRFSLNGHLTFHNVISIMPTRIQTDQ